MDKFKVVEIDHNHIGYISRILQQRWDYSIEKSLRYVDNYLYNKYDSNCFVACFNNIPIGMGTFHLENDIDIDLSPWCIGLYVEPDYRGNGLGYEITQKRFKWARRLGYEKIYLDTELAEKYHEKFGWKKIEECYREGRLTIVMEHDL